MARLYERGGVLSASIDCVCTDPPYGMNYVSGRREVSHKAIHDDAPDDLDDWLNEWVDELYRVLKPDTASFIFCSWHNVDKFKIAFERKFTLKNIIVWVKNNHGTGDLKGAFAPKHEFILHIQKGRKELYGLRYSDVLEFAKTDNSLHPTQKPIKLIEFLIEKATKENDVVLDTFLGSGTTALACMNLGRNFKGCEIDSDYCAIAKSRTPLHKFTL